MENASGKESGCRWTEHGGGGGGEGADSSSHQEAADSKGVDFEDQVFVDQLVVLPISFAIADLGGNYKTFLTRVEDDHKALWNLNQLEFHKGRNLYRFVAASC